MMCRRRRQGRSRGKWESWHYWAAVGRPTPGARRQCTERGGHRACPVPGPAPPARGTAVALPMHRALTHFFWLLFLQ